MQEAQAVRQPREQSQLRRGRQVPTEGSAASSQGSPALLASGSGGGGGSGAFLELDRRICHTLTQCKPTPSYCPQGPKPEPGSRGASTRCLLKGPFPSARHCDTLWPNQTSTLQTSRSQQSLTLFKTIDNPQNH